MLYEKDMLQAPAATSSHLDAMLRHGCERLRDGDPELYGLLEREFERQNTTLNLVASSSAIDPATQVCQASVAANVTAEGYPGHRYHGGCAIIDEIESLAIERAKLAFGAEFANVQTHSASIANELLLLRLLEPGDTLLGMRMDAGGHLTHGSRASVSGRRFNAIGYGVTDQGLLDYEQVRELAHAHRPKLIICGATAYPREIDFKRFRAIADEVDALLLADITHVAGLVAARLHPSPVANAHFTTTCTHKQLYGPRGGLVLMGSDRNRVWHGNNTLEKELQQGVFPFFQGAPVPNVIAAKARAFGHLATAEFRHLAQRIKDNARDLASHLGHKGAAIVSGGTDNHIVLIDVLSSYGLTGIVAQRALELCRINVNKNAIPRDKHPVHIASGVRTGSNTTALRGFGRNEMEQCAHLIDKVLRAVKPRGELDYDLSQDVIDEVAQEVGELCRRFPVGGYPGADPVRIEYA
ncbi:serine hydroxymethyltransferase [Dyella flagellata]|uniref:Serine hydroxymethyltransferase n=1 Tax=Dyella flagellata TaxID=1867833 RepID=A0ABQ5XB79_9GAMM|nr:serine hydroxymethyltransferase [Dyella flagellata]GLQ87919.1 serine hydroxymethyltransferase [Dyella flagellata]